MPEIGVHVVDARGLLCPLPVIRTQDAARRLAPGDVLEILATDPGTLQDLPAWCRVHGHELIMSRQEDEDCDEGRHQRRLFRFRLQLAEE